MCVISSLFSDSDIEVVERPIETTEGEVAELEPEPEPEPEAEPELELEPESESEVKQLLNESESDKAET